MIEQLMVVPVILLLIAILLSLVVYLIDAAKIKGCSFCGSDDHDVTECPLLGRSPK